ncbi:FecCD family ABC transporter permease [Erwinia amylovora]
MLVLMVVMVVLAANTGAMRLSLPMVWQAPADSMIWKIWFNIRLPRVLLAVLVGAALALSGAMMQGLFRNPLADPGLMGISSGASLMLAFSIVIPVALPAALAMWWPMLAAFTGSIAVTVIIFILSRHSSSTLSRLLLAGIAINALCGAAVGILSWLSNDQQLRQLSLWGMGSLSQAQWSTVLACAVVILPTMLATQWQARRLNLLQLGDEEAHYLGVDVRRTQRILLVLSALMVAAAVAVSGIIGFVGLVVPHLIRLCIGGDHRWLLPGATLLGAILMLLADTLARTMVAPAEMPVGLLTSLLGAPWFLWLILRRQEGRYE